MYIKLQVAANLTCPQGTANCVTRERLDQTVFRCERLKNYSIVIELRTISVDYCRINLATLIFALTTVYSVFLSS